MIENEGIRVREARYCLMCGDEGAMLYSGLRDCLFGAPGRWGLMQCPRCRLVWLNPQPIPDDVGKLYAQYHTHQTFVAPKRLACLRKGVKASILKSRYGYQTEDSNKVIGAFLSYIAPPLREIVGSSVRWLKASENGRLLDVGCGNGRFLDQMRQLGWNVTGIEPDGEAVSVACEKFGLEVFQGSLEKARFANGHFDAITMNNVIEHAPDPIELLRECCRVLKPNGEIVVVTPNIKSLGHNVFGENWRGLEVLRHLFLFTPQALRACAESAGLDVQELRTTAISAPWMWVTSNLIRRDGTLPGSSCKEAGLWMWLQSLAFWAREHWLSGLEEAGEALVLVAGKK